VLGGDLHEQLRGGEASSKGDVDVDVLLRGAERLCNVYALPGAVERIHALRNKHANLANTMAYYEGKVTEQAQALELINREHRLEKEEGEEEEEEEERGLNRGGEDEDGEDAGTMTEEDLHAEEDELRKLDGKKRELQERIRAMERDLGALRNM
jgi:hypothetical protein